MPRDIKSPEEVKMGFWLRNLRLAGNVDIDEFLDYLFGSTKYDASEIRALRKEGEQEEGQGCGMGDMLEKHRD